MRIKKLSIKNFRGVRDIEIAPDKDTVFITGLNGSGKTSIMHALRMALFGRCALTSRDGKKAGALVRHGAKEAMVTLEMDTGRIDLAVTAKGQKRWVAKVDGTEYAEPSHLWGRDLERHEVAADPLGYLVSGEIGGVLSDALGGGIDLAQLEKLCGEHWPHVASMPHEPTVSDLKSYGAKTYEKRAEMTPKIRHLKRSLESGSPSLPLDKNSKPVSPDKAGVIKESLVKAKYQRDELIKEKHQAEAVSQGALARSSDAAQLDMDGLLAKRDEANTRRAELANRRDSAKQQREKLIQSRSNLKASHARAESELKSAEREIAQHKEADASGKCPTCGREWTKKAKKDVMAPALARANEARDAIKVIESDITNIDAQLKEHDTADLDTEILGIEREVHDFTREIDRLTAELERGKLAADTRPVEAIQEELDGVLERIERGEAILSQIDDVANYRAEAQRLEQLEAEYAELDWIVKAFKDGSVLNQLMQGSAGGFVEGVNAALEPHGYMLSVEVDGKRVSIMAGRDGASAVPFEHLSKGEQCLVSMAFARQFSGDAPMILDDLDGLDGKHKPLVFRELADAPGQKWLAAAWGLPGDPKVEAMSKAMDANVVHVESGGVAARKGEAA